VFLFTDIIIVFNQILTTKTYGKHYVCYPKIINVVL